MILVTGGAFQGKKGYVIKEFGVDTADIGDGDICEPQEMLNYKVAYKFHLTIKKIYECGGDIDTFLDECFLKSNVKIIIADEIGRGVIPIDTFSRNIRDEVGLALVKIAAKSDKLIRVSCGLPLIIKAKND